MQVVWEHRQIQVVPIRGHFPHKFWSSYEYHIHRQNKRFFALLNDHTSPHIERETIPFEMVNTFWARFSISFQHMFFGVHIKFTTNCTPPKYKCPFKNKHWIRHVYLKQESGRNVRLCPLLWKTTTVAVHFAHASPWLFTIPITKPFLDFVHLLLKCGSRTEATHLSPEDF